MVQLNDILFLLDAPDELKSKVKKIDSAQAITDKTFGNSSIGWCSDKNVNLLNQVKGGTIIVSWETYHSKKEELNDLCLIPVVNPRRGFLKVLQQFFVSETTMGVVNQSAQIDNDVKYNPKMVNIGPNVVIESGSEIGDFVSIGANTVIKSNTIIENNCKIGSNCTIGGVGFGYELNEENSYELMPHIGNVHIGENVEIGNNVCIDRAVMGSTILSENVKVDNLVHIAHGVHVGRNSLIIANAMIAGSVEVGENVWISPSASIRQKLQVESDSLVGMGAVVVKNVTKSSIVAGNPAKPFK